MTPEDIRAHMRRGGRSEEEIEADLATLVYDSERVRFYRALVNDYRQTQGLPPLSVPYVRVGRVLYTEEVECDKRGEKG